MNITIKPLDAMIELWRGIEGLHFYDHQLVDKNQPPLQVVDLRARRLRYKARMVVSALRHYRIELEKKNSDLVTREE
jgi:hypothetical protein